MSHQLFSQSLISPAVQAQLPEGYLMRPLEITDYHKGFYDCLAGLTVVGKVSQESFRQTFESMLRCQNVYHVVVIEELKASRIVATGTLIVEQKFLRGCGKAGHIEDIVVHDSQRGKKFGIRLIDQLRYLGNAVGCYKLLLTCSETNEPFYEKSGFERKDLHMAQYLNQQQQQPQTITVEPPTTAAAPTTTTTTMATETNINTTKQTPSEITATTTATVDSVSMIKSCDLPIKALGASIGSMLVK
ncbi:Glucosamine-phosphate N-acetyltransferase-like protein [Entomortierella chlamydospora]|nr:Glucosamine-phosphate N-acetyltransferase-like protein [Entomortierella chlamydospora]